MLNLESLLVEFLVSLHFL